MKSNRENKIDRNCKLSSFPHNVKKSSLSASRIFNRRRYLSREWNRKVQKQSRTKK